MRRMSIPRVLRLTLIPAVVLAMLISSPVAEADEPMLAVRLLDGGDAIYAVSEIDRVVFEGDSLFVLKSGASESHALGSVEKIEFLWGFSGVAEPEEVAHVLKALRLFQNRPNPFTPVTKIGFELAQAGRVELAVYSVDGRLIRTLINEDRHAGSHEAIWDGCDAEGKKVASGVYFYKLAAPGIAESRRMILLP